MAKKKMTPDDMRARYAELSVLFDECGHSDDTCYEVLGDDMDEDDYWILQMLQARWNMRGMDK